jgi:hypothetical protein
LVGGRLWKNSLELLNLSRLFTEINKKEEKFSRNFVFYRSGLASHALVDEWKAFVVSPSPLFTLSLNMGKTIVKVKYLLASMTFLCYSCSFNFRRKINSLQEASRFALYLSSCCVFYQLFATQAVHGD